MRLFTAFDRRLFRAGLIAAAAAAVFVFDQRSAAGADPESAGARYASEVRSALAPLIRTHGPDAVNLQGNLLRYSIDNGSLLEASVGISATEEFEATSYLIITVDTGLVFKPSEVPAAARPLRVWTDVIEPSIRQCKTLRVSADGIEIRASYHYSEFLDRADLARRVRQGSVAGEVTTFFIKTADAAEFAHGRIPAESLLRRARIRVGDLDLQLGAPTPDPPND